MDVLVEFSGISRVVTGQQQVTLDLATGATYRDVVRALAHRCPELLGEVVEEEGDELLPSNMLNLNGKRMIQPEQLDDALKDGDHLTLMSILAGG